MYCHQLSLVVHYVHKDWPDEIQPFEEKYDIQKILDQKKHKEEMTRKIQLEEELLLRIPNSLMKGGSSKAPFKSRLPRFVGKK